MLIECDSNWSEFSKLDQKDTGLARRTVNFGHGFCWAVKILVVKQFVLEI
jgi:hypothetical protein